MKTAKMHILVLGIVSLACSRTWFAFIDDPEGPNLLIVVALAAMLFGLSLGAYRFAPLSYGLKKLAAAILVQVVAAGILYLFLK